MGKKDCCAVFGCNNDCLFSEKYTVKFSVFLKARRNTEQVLPRHLIKLLKSNKFNMVTIKVKRSIPGVPISTHPGLTQRGGGGVGGNFSCQMGGHGCTWN